MGDSGSVVATAIAVGLGGVMLRAAVNGIVKWWGERKRPELWDRAAVGIVAALWIGIIVTILGAFIRAPPH